MVELLMHDDSRDKELIEWRVSKLEAAVEDLSAAVSDLRDFLISIRAWIKVAATAWILIQGVLIILIANLILNRGTA